MSPHHSRPRVLLACALAMLCLHPHQRARADETVPTAADLCERGKGLADHGKWAQAEVEFRAAVASATRSLGAEHPKTLEYSARLGYALRAQNKFPEVRELLARDYPIAKRVLKTGDPTLRLFASIAWGLDASRESGDKK